MQPRRSLLLVICVFGVATPLKAQDAGVKFISLFNGTDLTDWQGDERFWRVEDGAIVGQTTTDNPTKKNTFLVYTGDTVDDFELRFSYRVKGGNSGVQYRNGKVMSIGIDEDDANFRKSGILAWQLHSGDPLKIEMKNIRLRRMK